MGAYAALRHRRDNGQAGKRGTRRGEKRLVFRRSKGSWIIYYTEDHYKTFKEVK